MDDTLREGLRERMRIRGLTYAQTAKAAGLDIRTVKHFGGDSAVSTLAMLAEALGCRPSDLFSGRLADEVRAELIRDASEPTTGD